VVLLLSLLFMYLRSENDNVKKYTHICTYRVARWHIFKPRNANLGKIWSVLKWKRLVYFTAIWYFLCSFGTFSRFCYKPKMRIWGNFWVSWNGRGWYTYVYYMYIWDILWTFGTFRVNLVHFSAFGIMYLKFVNSDVHTYIREISLNENDKRSRPFFQRP
jgi:hypothetical protein